MVLTPEKIAQSGTLAGSSIGPPISGGSARQKIEKLQFLGVKPPKKGVFDPSERHFSRSLGFQEPQKRGFPDPQSGTLAGLSIGTPFGGVFIPPGGVQGPQKRGFRTPQKLRFLVPIRNVIRG